MARACSNHSHISFQVYLSHGFPPRFCFPQFRLRRPFSGVGYLSLCFRVSSFHSHIFPRRPALLGGRCLGVGVYIVGGLTPAIHNPAGRVARLVSRGNAVLFSSPAQLFFLSPIAFGAIKHLFRH